MGNVRVKRAKRGCEKDWNKKGDGAAKFFVGEFLGINQGGTMEDF